MIASSNAHDVAAGRLKAQDCAARGALHGIDKGTRSVAHPNGIYTTTSVLLERDPEWRWRLRPKDNGSGTMILDRTTTSVESFPKAGWRGLDKNGGASLRSAPDSVSLELPTVVNATAAVYGPLVAPETGSYVFSMRYYAGTEGFLLGIRSLPDLNWLFVDATGHRKGLDRVRQCEVALKAGQEFHLEISNIAQRSKSERLLILDLVGEVTRK